MRPQCESCVYIVNLCREIVANYSRTSLQLLHSSEIGALSTMSAFCESMSFLIIVQQIALDLFKAIHYIVYCMTWLTNAAFIKLIQFNSSMLYFLVKIVKSEALMLKTTNIYM